VALLREVPRVSEPSFSDAAYREFLRAKERALPPSGLEVREADLHPFLFPFQQRIVSWSLSRGRAAVFAHTGLGKTVCQLSWAHHVNKHTGKPVLILAPLAVTHQTAREAAKLDLTVTVCRTGADVQPGINATNYDRLHHFQPEQFGALVADESGILKSFSGAMRNQIIAFGSSLPFRLACTATPAPNDLIELGSHAEFLGVMNPREMAALFFRQDGSNAHEWRLKRHGEKPFFRWLSSWAVALRRPSDLGPEFDDGPFVLPPLNLHEQVVPVEQAPEGQLFAFDAVTLEEVRASMRASLPARVERAAALANADNEPWLLWCNLNAESEALAKAIPDAVEVRGSDSPEQKEAALLGFADGSIRVLVSKARIAGFGMNFQHCARVGFVGLSYSFEEMFQAVRRCWRFGQTRPVECHVITGETEGRVVTAIRRKERQWEGLMDGLIDEMRDLQSGAGGRDEMDYKEEIARGEGWTVRLGDSVERIRELEPESVGLCVTSVPFPTMYAYTNSQRDMGNVRDIEEMVRQFGFLAERMLPAFMPGRVCCIHLQQAMAFQWRDGYTGLKDFRGPVIETMMRAGWHYACDVTIDKNPQVKAARTKDRGLLFKTLATDSAMMTMASADYLLVFRKPGQNPRPVRAGISRKYDNPEGWITNEEWIEWAAPVWYRQMPGIPGGIKETDVLNTAVARDAEDERHLCALQLSVIERCVKLWSNPGDIVLDPFNGIGSTGYVALKLNRRYTGIEIKESYWRTSLRYLKQAERLSQQPTLFSLTEEEEPDVLTGAECEDRAGALPLSG
jgi:DNA modification methylase